MSLKVKNFKKILELVKQKLIYQYYYSSYIFRYYRIEIILNTTTTNTTINITKFIYSKLLLDKYIKVNISLLKT